MTDVELLLHAAEVLENDARRLPQNAGARTTYCECVDMAAPLQEWETPPDAVWNKSEKKWELPRQPGPRQPQLEVHFRRGVEYLLDRVSGGNLAAYRDAVWRWRDLGTYVTDVEGVIYALIAAAYYLDPEEVPPYVEPVKPKEGG